MNTNWNIIIHPKTQQALDLNSFEARKLLKQYVKTYLRLQTGGGSLKAAMLGALGLYGVLDPASANTAESKFQSQFQSKFENPTNIGMDLAQSISETPAIMTSAQDNDSTLTMDGSISSNDFFKAQGLPQDYPNYTPVVPSENSVEKLLREEIERLNIELRKLNNLQHKQELDSEKNLHKLTLECQAEMHKVSLEMEKNKILHEADRGELLERIKTLSKQSTPTKAEEYIENATETSEYVDKAFLKFSIFLGVGVIMQVLKNVGIFQKLDNLMKALANYVKNKIENTAGLSPQIVDRFQKLNEDIKDKATKLIKINFINYMLAVSESEEKKIYRKMINELLVMVHNEDDDIRRIKSILQAKEDVQPNAGTFVEELKRKISFMTVE